MKYLVAILICAIAIGSLVTVSAYYLFGSDAGFFVAKFVATPIGLIVGIACFLIYDSIWPKINQIKAIDLKLRTRLK